MVSLSSVEEQLKKVGCNYRFWGRAEIRELCHLLVDGEEIAQAVNGSYESGFAMLVATNSRVMLIDKKPKYLTLKDVRYDMITELDFSHRLMEAVVNIHTPSKTLRFSALNQARLRKLYHFVQERVIESRSTFLSKQQQQSMQPLMAVLGAGLQQLGIATSQTRQDDGQDEPTFVPSMTKYLENIEQLLPAQVSGSGPQVLTGQSDGSKIAAYANMPLIMKGWRRRVYGYHSKAYHKRFEGAV